MLWDCPNCKLSSLKLAKDLVDLESLIPTYLALFVLGGLLLMPDLDKFKERWQLWAILAAKNNSCESLEMGYNARTESQAVGISELAATKNSPYVELNMLLLP